MVPRIMSSLMALYAILGCLQLALAQKDDRYITYTGQDGTVTLADDRRPSLYTQNFGDCSGDSVVNLTRFDAAYYKDNMTVQFHLAGNTGVANDSVMLYIGVYAYGNNYFNQIFNPCSANINR